MRGVCVCGGGREGGGGEGGGGGGRGRGRGGGGGGGRVGGGEGGGEATCPAHVPGVSRMTEVTMSEQMTRMTSRAIAIPFQFLCGGLLPTSSWTQREHTHTHGKKKGQKQFDHTVDRK